MISPLNGNRHQPKDVKNIPLAKKKVQLNTNTPTWYRNFSSSLDLWRNDSNLASIEIGKANVSGITDQPNSPTGTSDAKMATKTVANAKCLIRNCGTRLCFLPGATAIFLKGFSWLVVSVSVVRITDY